MRGDRGGNFEAFMKKCGISGIRDVALTYATQNDLVTYDVISEKYQITKSVVRRCIEYAIIYSLVDYNVALKAREKAHRNQIKHMTRYAVFTKSDRYYEGLFQKRLAYEETLPDAREIMSKLNMLRYQRDTHEGYSSDKDINEGYPSKEDIEWEIFKLEEQLNLLKSMKT